MYTRYLKLICLFAILASTLLYSFSSIKAQDLELHMLTATHVTNYTIREYKKDAARLALGHLAEGRSLLELDVRIPLDIQQSLFNALIHIHDSQDPHAKKVAGMDIHTKAKPYYIDRIKIKCTSETTWTKPLKSGGIATSSEKINNKLDEYELEIIDYNKENNSFAISARNPLNMSKLAEKLSSFDQDIEFIVIPEIDEIDQNIEAKHVKGDTWIITFQKGKKEWRFKVDDAGNVLYLGK